MDKRILLPNRLDNKEIRSILIQALTVDMRRIAGYIPRQLDVTGVTLPYSLPKPLVLVRNQPVFAMNAGWVDFAVDYLREMGMESVVFFEQKTRKQADGTIKEVIIKTNSIEILVGKLRKYVRILDDKYMRGVP